MRDIRNKEKIMNRKRSKKKSIGISLAVIVILGIIGSVNGEEVETANTPNVTESTEAVLRSAEQEIYTTELETPQEAKTELEEAKPESDNPLMNAKIQIADVMNGTKNEKLGEWAEIQISKEILEEITQEQFSEFCNDVVNESGYNWFTISCEDGTGIQFAGSIPYVSTYGSLDNEGCIAESMGTIMVQEDGKYIYTEVE
ncbi:hypothetical protein IMSAGC019_03655 [Lachnospiraceae bacterium]|nr:hypothetical protein IMSAGC019_03655 [Lachnospiraceae bacterium]